LKIDWIIFNIIQQFVLHYIHNYMCSIIIKITIKINSNFVQNDSRYRHLVTIIIISIFLRRISYCRSEFRLRAVSQKIRFIIELVVWWIFIWHILAYVTILWVFDFSPKIGTTLDLSCSTCEDSHPISINWKHIIESVNNVYNTT
jgi:hypothetical protein